MAIFPGKDEFIHVDLKEYKINIEATSTISKKIALRYNALPIDIEGDSVIVAVAGPIDAKTLKDLELIIGSKIKLVRAEKEVILEKIDEYLLENVNLNRVKLSPGIIELINRNIALRYSIFPFDSENGEALVATSGHLGEEERLELEKILGMKIKLMMAKKSDIMQKIEEFYPEEKAEVEEIEKIDLNSFPIDINAVAVLSKRDALKYIALPIGFEEEDVIVAVASPLNDESKLALEKAIGAKIKTVLGKKEDIMIGIEQYLGTEFVGEEISPTKAEAPEEIEETREKAEVAEDLQKKVESIIEEIEIEKEKPQEKTEERIAGAKEGLESLSEEERLRKELDERLKAKKEAEKARLEAQSRAKEEEGRLLKLEKMLEEREEKEKKAKEELEKKIEEKEKQRERLESAFKDIEETKGKAREEEEKKAREEVERRIKEKEERRLKLEEAPKAREEAESGVELKELMKSVEEEHIVEEEVPNEVAKEEETEAAEKLLEEERKRQELIEKALKEETQEILEEEKEELEALVETPGEEKAFEDFEYLDISKITPNLGALAIIPEAVARKYIVLPIDFEENQLVLAMANPKDVMAIDDLRIITGFKIKPVFSTKEEILGGINKHLGMESSVSELIEESGKKEEEEEIGAIGVEESEAVGEDNPIVKFANAIITKAILDEASDIHVEPQEEDLRIRYRIDGVLHEVMRQSKKIMPPLISRLKIMSGMDIGERRVPQDGRIAYAVGRKTVDLRVVALPTIYGEKIVLRILERSSVLLDLEELGFLPETLKKYKKAFNKPYGTILITGPTGSGKSTTLYATLNILNSTDRNILTIEDPVEYRLPGISQTQVNPKAGLTFASALKYMPRHDPNIILVGEIRDSETAQIAIEAALTGHLVFSTLHTNDAAGALPRLSEMGVESFLIASAMDCVIAQRLARKLCPNCKEAYELPKESLEKMNFPMKKGERITIYRAKGCRKCKQTGYKGRIAVFELLQVTEEIKDHIIKGDPASVIKETAIKQGMQTLIEDGFEKVKIGIISIEELLRVVKK